MTFNVQLQEMRKTYFKHISFISVSALKLSSSPGRIPDPVLSIVIYYMKKPNKNKKKKKFKCAADTESEPFQTQHLCIIIVCMSNLEKRRKIHDFLIRIR